MKKPIRPTPEIIAERAAKRKFRRVKVEKALRGTTLASITEQITSFAKMNGVASGDVKISNNNWGSPKMYFTRLETDEERLNRTRRDLQESYNNKVWEYKRFLSREQKKKEVAARMSENRDRIGNGQCPTCGCTPSKEKVILEKK